jgi:hypothetical protein
MGRRPGTPQRLGPPLSPVTPSNTTQPVISHPTPPHRRHQPHLRLRMSQTDCQRELTPVALGCHARDGDLPTPPRSRRVVTMTEGSDPQISQSLNRLHLPCAHLVRRGCRASGLGAVVAGIKQRAASARRCKVLDSRGARAAGLIHG